MSECYLKEKHDPVEDNLHTYDGMDLEYHMLHGSKDANISRNIFELLKQHKNRVTYDNIGRKE